jgi:hypothetical protein
VGYASTASGAASPTRTISGSATGLAETGAIRIDPAGNIYVVVGTSATYSFSFSLSKFASSASGNIAPSATLTSASWTEAGPQIAIR